MEKIKVLLKSYKNNTYLRLFMKIFRRILRKRNVSDQSSQKKKNSSVQSHFFLPKIMPFLDNVKKCGTARQATDDNIICRWRSSYRINKAKM